MSLRARIERLERAAPADGPDPLPPHFWDWLAGCEVQPDATAANEVYWERASRVDPSVRDREPDVVTLRAEWARLGIPEDPQLYDYDFDPSERLLELMEETAKGSTRPVAGDGKRPA